MPIIHQLTASEILDSRGRPTLKATCLLAGGAVGAASVPSGASTGSSEALELRDGDPRRYRGLGVRQAAAHVNREMNERLTGCQFETSQALDAAMVTLDGTPDKRRLGANAILAVSLAFARAFASERRQPLYEYFLSLIHI